MKNIMRTKLKNMKKTVVEKYKEEKEIYLTMFGAMALGLVLPFVFTFLYNTAI